MIEPRNETNCGADVVFRAEGSIIGSLKGELWVIHRGRRAGHVVRGSPGTWEISFSPRRKTVRASSYKRSGPEGERRLLGANSRDPVVLRNEGNEVKWDGKREIGAA